MAKKKRVYQKKSFESTGIKDDISANIYKSMVLSLAWEDLTKNQQLLYLYCKLQCYGEKKKPNSNPIAFTMNQDKWMNKYKLYSKSNASSFYSDMEALILHGFIRCIRCGAIARQKNYYEYSDKWQIWSTSNFKITHNEMTLRMLNKNK